jgi:outer membrane receptor for ferrienterochelin and colicins
MRTRSLPLVVVALTLFGDTAWGQTGRIAGIVSDRQGPVAGAQVLASPTGLAAVTSANGRFTLQDLAPGRYELRVYRLGYATAQLSDIYVPSGGITDVSVNLLAVALQLEGLVVSASRRPQRLLEAPGAVSVVDEKAIVNTIGNAYAPALKAVKGLEFNHVGVTTVLFNTRGFNSPVNTRMLMLEDRRIATMTETGLPLGPYSTIPKLDIATVEVLAGPGSALYGANAGNGVLSLTTKDARDSEGVDAEVSFGSREFFDVQGRFATASTKWGYKISAEYLRAREWLDTLFYSGGTGPIPELGNDQSTHVARATTTLSRYLAGSSRIDFTVGTSERDGLVKNSVGRVRSEGHIYQNYQLRYINPRLFAQVYGFRSNTGATLQLNTYSQTRTRFPTMPLDSVREVSRFPADSRTYVADIEHNFVIGSLQSTGLRVVDRTLVTWGGQHRRDWVTSWGRVFLDRWTGEPIIVNASSGYLQAEAALTSALRVIAGARYDTNSRFSSQISPRFAAVLTQRQHVFTVNYSHGYRAPPFLSQSLYIPDIQGPAAGVFANTAGFLIKDNSGTVLRTVAPLRSEINKTWEVGYRTLLRDRLFLDFTLYRSRYIDFITGAATIAIRDRGEIAYYRDTDLPVADSLGRPRTVLSFYNIAKAKTSGVDASLRLLATPRLELFVTANMTRFGDLEQAGGPPDAAKFNASPARITAGTVVSEPIAGLNAGLTARYVHSYDFRGGVDFGRIPSFGTLDANASYRIAASPVILLFQAQNVFACVGGALVPPPNGVNAQVEGTYIPARKCGFGQRHRELLNMPAVGSMFFIGARVSSRRQ